MAKKKDDGKIFAFLAYLLSIVGFLIVLLAKKDDKFAMYHAKQSLVLFIVYIIGWAILAFIPILGWSLMPIWWVLMVIMTIIGIINAWSGKEKPLPLIGHFAKKINL